MTDTVAGQRIEMIGGLALSFAIGSFLFLTTIGGLLGILVIAYFAWPSDGRKEAEPASSRSGRALCWTGFR